MKIVRGLLVLPIVLLLIAVGVAGWASCHHLVRTDHGYVLLNKRFITFTDSHADIRCWSSADYDAHPDLKQALIDQGYGDIISELRRREMKAAARDQVEAVGDKARELGGKMHRKIDEWLGKETPEPAKPAADAAGGK